MFYISTDSEANGLATPEAARRLRQFGPNAIPVPAGDSLSTIFISQFRSPLIYLLLVASAVILLLGEVADGLIILFVLVFNAIVGTIQEGRAQNTLQALRDSVQTTATVLRDGREEIIPDDQVVPGDVILLAEGEKVPADARLFRAANLKVDEAALTGESEPVHKEAEDLIRRGTSVVAGHGRAAVTATGKNTMIGSIAQEVAAIDSSIPLQADIRSLARLVIISVLAISAVLFVIGIFLGHSIPAMFTTVVSLSVSIIPEGLPIVLTLVLATGVWRMSQRHALVKKLQAVEALGQARVIAVDKTGTLTKNELVVQRLFVAGEHFSVSGSGYEPKGIVHQGQTPVASQHPALQHLGLIVTFCANARLLFNPEQSQWRVVGDPTEAALLVLGQKLGFDKDALERAFPLRFELPFDYQRKYHATVHERNGKNFLAVVGAPETVLQLSQLSTAEREKTHRVFEELSAQGLRVLALAESDNASLPLEDIGRLRFVGLVGMKDALRPEVLAAVERVRSAGMRVVVITGDHTVTARAIAQEAGIWQAGDQVLTGQQIEDLSPDQLAAAIETTSIFARVSPLHKLRIIKAFQRRGEIIAMTGDGVNDAPSLVAADLGVAMGQIGTEVAKEAADIVLLDDNFGSIVAAVEEGRGIYKSIQRVILYLFSTGVGEVLVISGALLLGYPLPLVPAQIIWLNFVTDGFLDVALAMEPKEGNLLRGRWQRPKRYLVSLAMLRRMMIMALPMTIGTLWMFQRYLAVDPTKAWTISLTTLAVFQWFNAWNCRSEQQSAFRQNPWSNKYLIIATGIVIGLQLLAVYTPFLQTILRTSPLALHDWALVILVASSIVVVEEARKLVSRRLAWQSK